MLISILNEQKNREKKKRIVFINLSVNLYLLDGEFAAKALDKSSSQQHFEALYTISPWWMMNQCIEMIHKLLYSQLVRIKTLGGGKKSLVKLSDTLYLDWATFLRTSIFDYGGKFDFSLIHWDVSIGNSFHYLCASDLLKSPSIFIYVTTVFVIHIVWKWWMLMPEAWLFNKSDFISKYILPLLDYFGK